MSTLEAFFFWAFSRPAPAGARVKILGLTGHGAGISTSPATPLTTIARPWPGGQMWSWLFLAGPCSCRGSFPDLYTRTSHSRPTGEGQLFDKLLPHGPASAAQVNVGLMAPTVGTPVVDNRLLKLRLV
jgi:hypothetical protein